MNELKVIPTVAKLAPRLRTLLPILILPALLVSGCISLAPTPNYARAGDVVNIGLGGIKRNAAGQRVLPEDLVVTITDANNVTHTPEVLGTYRVYPDHASQYAVRAQRRDGGNYADLYPHDGATWVSIRLTSFASGSNPLPLAVGSAYISVASAKLEQTSKPNEGSYNQFDIEILPGTGNPSVLDDNQNVAYAPEGYLSIIPDSEAPGGTVVAGAQLEIIFDDSVTFNDPFELRLVPQHHDPNLSLIQSVIDNGDGTKTLTAFLTNPNGFAPVETWAQGQSTFYDLQLALTSFGGGVASQNQTPAEIAANFTVTANSYYVDVNGDQIVGMTPIILNEFY